MQKKSENIKKVPVKGKNGLYSIINESKFPRSMSIAEIAEILERPLPNLKENPKTSKAVTSE